MLTHAESLTFISIFTDMAGRLPRHRTMPFVSYQSILGIIAHASQVLQTPHSVFGAQRLFGARVHAVGRAKRDKVRSDRWLDA